MEHVQVFQVIAEIRAFFGPQNAQRQTDERPQMNDRVPAAIVFTQLVNLRMAIVACGNAVIRARCLNLGILQTAVFQARLVIARLQKAAAAAATVVVRAVGLHVDEILFTHYGFDDKPQVFRNGIPVTLADNLAGILNREFDFQVLVPVRIDLQFTFPDPFRIIFIDILDDELVGDVELFQSCQD